MNPALAALIIHDLKNGLGALEAQLLTLQRDLGEAQLGPTYHHCVDLRQRFVQFLALYGGDREMRAHAADESPIDLLRLILKDCAPLMPGLTVQLALDDDTPSFWYFDRRLVRLALEAALHNAGRYAESTVTLSALVEDGLLVFRVDDDGPGPVPPDPDDPQATGLGTALCQAVAKAHDIGQRTGFARLLSRPGGGARFELGLA